MSPIGRRDANLVKRDPNRRDPCLVGPPAVARNHPSLVHYYCCYTLSTAGENVVEVNGSMDSVLMGIGKEIAHGDVGLAN